MNNFNLDWAEGINCAVTICNTEGVILYMNARARDTYASHGNLIGKNLFACHSERSQNIIRELLSTGKSNTYMVKKKGIKKLIFQSPWRDDSGKIAGLVEISIPLPEEMAFYDRDAQ